MAALKLIIGVVDHGLGEALVDATKRAGAQGGTILLGRGTAQRQWMQLLGLDDARKEVTFTIAPSEMVPRLLDGIRTDGKLAKVRGVAIVLPVNQLIRHLTVRTSEDQGDTMLPTTHELISVIVNSGYADDVMAAARKAGAKGGTIINARGTGREEDAKFFGLTLVPEKELLLIISTREESPAILEAIRETPCLTQAGMGIAFCTSVTDFVPLGTK